MATCVSGKIVYFSPKKAARATVKAKEREDLELDFYKCNWCRWWHLTSQIRREKEEKDY